MDEDLSIGAIIVRKQPEPAFLILKRSDNGIWDFPKGHPKPNEPELETLKRELREETNILHFTNIANFQTSLSYLSSRGVKRVMKFYLISSDDAICLSPEHSEMKWITVKDAPTFFRYDDILDILKKCERVANGS